MIGARRVCAAREDHDVAPVGGERPRKRLAEEPGGACDDDFHVRPSQGSINPEGHEVKLVTWSMVPGPNGPVTRIFYLLSAYSGPRRGRRQGDTGQHQLGISRAERWLVIS